MLNDWAQDDQPQYLKNRIEIALIARFRLGNEFQENKRWLKEEERKCRLCKIDVESAERTFEKCKNYKTNKKTEEILSESGLGVNIMKGIIWKRKREKGNNKAPI